MAKRKTKTKRKVKRRIRARLSVRTDRGLVGTSTGAVSFHSSTKRHHITANHHEQDRTELFSTEPDRVVALISQCFSNVQQEGA